MRAVAFPAALLVFMVPLPTALRGWVDAFLQHASADVVDVFFKVSGTPILRDGLMFQLPGITVQVAEECSGIRSSLVLLITSLIAGYMFLRSPGRRAVLAAAVVPLAILRNAVRIFIICMLCVWVDPSMINSLVHKRGGPLFFVASIVPLVLLLLVLRRAEASRGGAAGSDRGNNAGMSAASSGGGPGEARVPEERG
jgi:exosortase C (VPDSG-CTERM-specific)